MHLNLIKNTDESKIILYKMARVVYAETNASSLPAVEALVSMIANLCIASKRNLDDIAGDPKIFDANKKDSTRHEKLLTDASRPDFQMCLRVVQKMLNGNLPDKCSGATRFHHADALPEWAMQRGYIAEVDDLLFYL